MTLMKPWRHLRSLIETWEKYQIQTCPNQDQGLEEMEKVYNPLHAGHCSYTQFQNEESLCTMCFPLETTQKLRQFVMTLSEDSNKDPPSTESQPSHSTHEEPLYHTSTSYTTAAGATAHADVLFSLASSDDQIARQFRLQTPAHGASTISSNLNSQPRLLKYLKVGGSDWGRDIRNKVLGQFQGPGHEPGRVLQILHPKLPHSVACDGAHGGQTSGADADKVCARKGTKCRKRAKGASEESIYDWLRENPVSPLSNIVHTPKWLADPVFQFIRLDDKRLQRAIQVFNDEMCSYSTLDFIEMYKNTQPLFDAPHGDLATFYMNVPASFDAVMELLNFQFHSIHEEVSAFVNNFTICNFNRYTSFPLQDTVGRRILVWNEPNCESSAFDTVKKIFGGDVDSVAVKYTADQTISRTPVIVLSNNEVFPDDDALNHRVWRYKWRACPPLKKYNKKIHPMALVLLFDTFVMEETYVGTRQLDQ
ncbi:hypothetical protein HPB51_021496 [Rhipicephalus microplus]|uniref:Parvovirus non-structural protein 1 helicase domain-containing protein n=1 Tax=Rhipicephalus microplus TaxID=6941 RepID=A0A9J6EQ35_RHIMP|nr:hypothetical protein HPB51_021496 [Rhipicephalus microplus]